MRARFHSLLIAASLAVLTACGGQQTSDEPAEPAAAAPEPAQPPSAPAAPAAPTKAFADLTGDAAAGKNVFMKCMSCHAIEDGQNKVGPHLFGVVGRAAGSVEGFNYSAANKESGITWSKEILFEYLENPQEYMKGTRMAFPGIKDPQERANLIEYLAKNGEI